MIGNNIGDRGKFIVLYGSNNLGKSAQIGLLEDEWKAIGRPYTRIKYPRYSTPSGMVLNVELRGEEKDKMHLTDTQMQELFAYDRRDYEPELLRLLSLGDVIGEDYVGTGMAWGLTLGVDRKLLDKYNEGLLEPDIAVLLDGERFTDGIEKAHRHESAGEHVWEMNRKIHQELAAEFGWEVVNANGSKEKVHEDIMAALAKRW